MKKEVDQFIADSQKWKAEFSELREILLEAGLQEDFKWRGPCYTFEGGNVAILGELKGFCTLSFFKGALLEDPQGVLVVPGEHSRATRYLKFSDLGAILSQKELLKSLLEGAIALEKSGARVDFSKNREVEYPEELIQKFEEVAGLQDAFENLTPGRQRGYLLHFGGAKQPGTRLSRIEKCRSRIFAGKGMHDCICGRSKKMPNCDGSHKN